MNNLQMLMEATESFKKHKKSKFLNILSNSFPSNCKAGQKFQWIDIYFIGKQLLRLRFNFGSTSIIYKDKMFRYSHFMFLS